jgi:hypothetical protein
MSFSKFSKSIYKSFLLLKNNGYKSFYIIFEGPNVNKIISYFGHLYNKILNLIMWKKKLYSNQTDIILSICP